MPIELDFVSFVPCSRQGPKDPSTVPLELSFMESYGAITQHLWFGDGYILVGFRSGQVVVVSSRRCVQDPFKDPYH
jgi:hypothetical protein